MTRDPAEEPVRAAAAEPPDGARIEALLAGDPVVIGEVRRWIRSAIARHGRSLASEIEDLEQETLLHLLEALDRGRFRGESRFETYVHAFARHRSIDRLRAVSRRQPVDLDGLDLETEEPSPFEETRQGEMEGVAREVLAGLSPACREIWTLIAEGHSYREMSRRLGVAEGALRVRAHRCRQKAIELREAATRARVTNPGLERPRQ